MGFINGIDDLWSRLTMSDLGDVFEKEYIEIWSKKFVYFIR